MPKRIPNLCENIVAEAARLFSEFGYDAVEMKQVAAEAGTSVGNLYNYFSSKPALFIAIVKSWRRQMFQEASVILGSSRGRREKILAILTILYDNFTSRQGLWKEFLEGREERIQFIEFKVKGSGDHRAGFIPEEVQTLQTFETLLTGASPTEQYRWSYILVMATIQLAQHYPQDREENWKFLETLVDKI